FVPLAGTQLETTLGDVVHDAVAGDEIERFLVLDVLRLRTDDDAQFDFPVELGRAARLDDVVVRPVDRGRGLHEDDRFGRDRHAGFLGMVRIVEADGDELADADERNAQPRAVGDDRQGFGLHLGEHLQAARRKLLRADVLHYLGQVAQAPFRVDDPRLLEAVLAIAAQLHIVIPPSIEYMLPVANFDSSDARKTRIPVMSSTEPRRPIGWRAMKSFFACTGSAKALMRSPSEGVSTVPGPMQLQ